MTTIPEADDPTTPVDVWFWVAGPKLPREPVTIGKFTLQRMDRENEPPLQAELIEAAEAYSSFTALYTKRVKGNCYAHIVVDAPDVTAAMDYAREHEVPMLVAALSLDFDQPYRVVPAFAVAGTDAESPIQFSYTFWDEDELGNADVSRLGAVVTSFEAHEPAGLAAKSFGHAITLHDLDPTVETFSSALLAYFKVIEVIAGSMRAEDAPEASQKRRDAVDGLQSTLSKDVDLREKVRAVNRAADELKRVDEAFTSLKIKRAAVDLNLGREWAEAAGRLLKFRNKRLGHGGKSPALHELTDWLDPNAPNGAPALARAVLRAFLATLERTA